jgi:hypothetical protein
MIDIWEWGSQLSSLSMSAILVRGRVLDSHRVPVVGASVMFSRGPVGVRDIAQVTGSDGEFQLSAPTPGTYSILVNASGFSAREETVDAVGPATPDVVIILRDHKQSRPQ